MNTPEMTEQTENLQETAQQAAQDWQRKAQEWKQSAMESARKASQVTDQYVHENAWTSVAMGVIVGCIIGFMLARPKD